MTLREVFPRARLAVRFGRVVSMAGVVALVLALVVVSSPPADAATFDVTRFDDPVPDGCDSGVDCSLREAVIDGNASGGPDVIDLPAGFYQLTITGSLESRQPRVTSTSPTT